MNIDLLLKTKIKESLSKLGKETNENDIIVTLTKDKSHGDYSSNVAMKFASSLGRKPFELAKDIIENIDKDGIDKIEIAGPGFINFFMSSSSITDVVKKIIEEDDDYGTLPSKGLKINLEYVSANPTGDLHLGHARGAAIGDSLARLLKKAGYEVTREYYINDAGNQINNLALSIQARYHQLFGEDIALNDDMYHANDIKDIAKMFKEEFGDTLLNNKDALSIFKEKGVKIELDKIIRDLEAFRVKFDVFSHETVVRSNNAVEKELEYLKPYTYVEDGATILKTDNFLDDKNRVIVKSNGDYTYFLPDIVYHLDKLSRGYDLLIDVLGADHHGYLNRMKSSLMMHGYKSEILDFVLIQMVRIFQDGKEITLSKRTGKTITLRELCQDCGTDFVRYFFVSRSASSHLDFNMDLAKEKSASNPVYYAQYAHARLASVLKNIDKYPLDISATLLTSEKELELMKTLIDYSSVINSAANNKEVSLLTNYIYKLATIIHSFYTECRVLDPNNIELTRQRLALCKASAIVMKNALNLIGVEAPNEM